MSVANDLFVEGCRLTAEGSFYFLNSLASERFYLLKCKNILKLKIMVEHHLNLSHFRFVVLFARLVCFYPGGKLYQNNTYLLNASMVFAGSSNRDLAVSTEPWQGHHSKAEIWDFPVKNRTSQVNKQFTTWLTLGVCRYVIGRWALWKSNALALANQNAHYIAIYKHKS